MSSPVVLAWEKLEYIVQEAQKGHLATCCNKKGGFTRRDVVNNADLLGPLIHHVGVLTLHQRSQTVEPYACKIEFMSATFVQSSYIFECEIV